MSSNSTTSGGIARPVFILAPPRSFSTVVSAMVGQHPELYGLPEIHLFGAETVAEFLKQCNEASYRMADGLLRTIAQLYFGHQTDDTVARASGWLVRRAHYSAGLLFETIAARVYPLALVEKSPSLVYTVDSLRRVRCLFPDARFIHLLRHPVGQGKSVLKYMKRIEEEGYKDGAGTMHNTLAPTHWVLYLASYPYQFEDQGDALLESLDPQRGWYALNSNICEFLSELPSECWTRIRGEDLLGEPDRFLPVLAEWLGVSRTNHAIEEMKHPERSPYACYGPQRAKWGNDHFFIDSPVLRSERAAKVSLTDRLSSSAAVGLHPRVVALAREFGYN
jgi:hypothetical protein